MFDILDELLEESLVSRILLLSIHISMQINILFISYFPSITYLFTLLVWVSLFPLKENNIPILLQLLLFNLVKKNLLYIAFLAFFMVKLTNFCIFVFIELIIKSGDIELTASSLNSFWPWTFPLNLNFISWQSLISSKENK